MECNIGRGWFEFVFPPVPTVRDPRFRYTIRENFTILLHACVCIVQNTVQLLVSKVSCTCLTVVCYSR
jgi:hypothetical protein